MLRRILPLVVAACVASCVAATGLGAQKAVDDVPARPELPKNADPNDWRSHYDAGLRIVSRFPAKAATHFWWASRLWPAAAEPVYARWVALSLQRSDLLQRDWKPDSPEARELARIDSVLLEALAIDPFTPRHYSRLVYEARPGFWPTGDLPYGYLAYTEGAYERATRLLGRVTKGDREPIARLYRALSFYAMQRYDSAAAELERLAALAARANETTLTPVYEGAAVYHYGVGLARMRLGDLDGARDALQRALGEDMALAAAHVALAEVAVKRADTTTVLREWSMAVELRPSSGALHGDHGNALRALGRLDQALEEYDRAIELEPYWSAPYLNSALVLDQLGRRTDAFARYAQFLERAPLWLETAIAHAKTRVQALSGR